MAIPLPKPLSIDEFLDWDGADDQRWELEGGVPVAMAAPSGAHQIMVANFAYRLVEALTHRPPCSTRVDAPIAIAHRTDTCHIADLAVTCQPHAPGQQLTPEPSVIVEILSPSTERRDRKVKLPDYRALPTVMEIVLIDQQELYREVHRRLDDGRWLVDLLRRPEARLRLETIGFDQPLEALYTGVGLEA